MLLPTPKLRWVDRAVPKRVGWYMPPATYRVLQQWWEQERKFWFESGIGIQDAFELGRWVGHDSPPGIKQGVGVPHPHPGSPTYLLPSAQGEWRDVPTETE